MRDSEAVPEPQPPALSLDHTDLTPVPSFRSGRKAHLGWPDEQSMGELELNYSADAVSGILPTLFSATYF